MKLKNKKYRYFQKKTTLTVRFIFFILIITACTNNDDSSPKSAGIAFVSDQASPFFLEKGRQGWMLDFVSMSKLIGFNHKNQWHLRQRNHKYMFGFKGISFDKNGFPHQ